MDALALVLILGSLLGSVGSELCPKEAVDGYRLEGHTVKTIQNVGVNSCIRECLLRPGHCKSINYDKQQFICELNRVSVNISVDGSKTASYLYSPMDSHFMVDNYSLSTRENLIRVYHLIQHLFSSSIGHAWEMSKCNLYRVP